MPELAPPLIPPELLAAVRLAVAGVAPVEPIAVDEATAARLCGLSYKTLAGLPAERTGRFKVGRAVRYELATLRQFVRGLVGTSIETPEKKRRKAVRSA